MATNVVFQFWRRADPGDPWDGPYSDIADVPDARYIKVRATLTRDASKMPVLEDMTVGYFKKTNILANWIFFNMSAKDIDAFLTSKKWTSTADFLSGVLSNTLAIDNELRLAQPNSSGYADYVFDVAEA